MYYNNELKERYIKEKKATTILPDNYLENLFRTSSEFENKLKKDIGNFTVPQIIDFYKNLNSSSIGRLKFTNSSLKQYTHWCLTQSLLIDSRNYYEEIDYETIKSSINLAGFRMGIYTRERIDEWCEILCNPCDKFLLKAIFEGIRGKNMCELADLRLPDFNLDEQTVTLHNGNYVRTIHVSNELCDLAVEAANEQYFYPNNGDGSSTVGTEIKYIYDPDLILKNHPVSKSYVTPFQIGKRIKNKIDRVEKITGEYITAKDLAVSGKIHFINEKCKELGISGKKFLYSGYIEELNRQFGQKHKRSTFYNDYEDYLT